MEGVQCGAVLHTQALGCCCCSGAQQLWSNNCIWQVECSHLGRATPCPASPSDNTTLPATSCRNHLYPRPADTHILCAAVPQMLATCHWMSPKQKQDLILSQLPYPGSTPLTTGSCPRRPPAPHPTPLPHLAQVARKQDRRRLLRSQAAQLTLFAHAARSSQCGSTTHKRHMHTMPHLPVPCKDTHTSGLDTGRQNCRALSAQHQPQPHTTTGLMHRTQGGVRMHRLHRQGARAWATATLHAGHQLARGVTLEPLPAEP
jgi:hypothetical protein